MKLVLLLFATLVAFVSTEPSLIDASPDCGPLRPSGTKGCPGSPGSADPAAQGSVVLKGQKPWSGRERLPFHDRGYQRKIWDGKHGHLSTTAGGDEKLPGQRWKPATGILGARRSRRAAKSRGKISVKASKPMSGRDRRPTYNAKYQRNVVKGKKGRINVSGGVQKRPGQRLDSNVGVKGTWKPDPKSRISFEGNKPITGRDRRPSYNVDYQRNIWKGKNGEVSVGAGAQKLPGQRVEPNVGVQGTLRFRRSPDPKKKKKNRVNVEVNKPIRGPERRPSYNVDYQREVLKGKNGEVSVGGGAQKRPGQRWKSNVGVKGSWRFRRAAEPNKKKKQKVTEEVKRPRSGPEPNPLNNANYQRDVFTGTNPGLGLGGGGAQKRPTNIWDPNFWKAWGTRSRRSPDPKKKKRNRVNVEVDKPMSGPERRPSYNVDYQREVWKGKNGEVSVGGGAQKRPGQRWESNVGVKGSWRFRRSPDPQREILVDANNLAKKRNRCAPGSASYQQKPGKKTGGKTSVGASGAKPSTFVPNFRW